MRLTSGTFQRRTCESLSYKSCSHEWRRPTQAQLTRRDIVETSMSWAELESDTGRLVSAISEEGELACLCLWVQRWSLSQSSCACCCMVVCVCARECSVLSVSASAVLVCVAVWWYVSISVSGWFWIRF